MAKLISDSSGNSALPMRALCAVLCLALLSGCGLRERLFQGAGQSATVLPYTAKLSRGEDRRNFVVTVRAAGDATLEDVRESARFPATRYCLNIFGGSVAEWELDPETGDWAVARTTESLSVNGRCTAR